MNKLYILLLICWFTFEILIQNFHTPPLFFLATFAMVVALLIRRAQIAALELENDLKMLTKQTGALESQADLWIEESEAQTKAILRLVYILEKG